MRATIAAAATILAALAASPAAAQSGGVFVVGDSLEVGTSPYLAGYLPGLSVRVDADESRSSTAAAQVVRERTLPSDAVVVFDVGSNNDPAQPEVLAADIAAVGEQIGSRCLVLATLTRPPYNGVSYDALNAVATSYAAQRPNTQLVDWRSYAAAHPGLLYGDGVHPTAGGYDLRARLIADGIQSCFASAPSPGVAAPEADAAPARFDRLAERQVRQATAARLLAMRFLEGIEGLARAPGDGAAALLLGAAVAAPQLAAEASRRSGARPGSRRRSPPRRSR
jgi:hypothetical protein